MSSSVPILTRFRKLAYEWLIGIEALTDIIPAARIVFLWPSSATAAEFPALAYNIQTREPEGDFVEHGWSGELHLYLFGTDPDVLDQAEEAIRDDLQVTDAQDRLTDGVCRTLALQYERTSSNPEMAVLLDRQVLEVRDVVCRFVFVATAT